MEGDFDPRQVGWNLSQGLLFEIGNLLVLANQKYLAGDRERWFYTLKAIKFRVIHSFRKEEREALKKLEATIQGGIGRIERFEHHSITNMDKEELQQLRTANQKINKIEEYNELLMDYLDKYSYLIKKKEDHTDIN